MSRRTSSSSLSSDERVKWLKVEDPEKFQTLVMMHLSFLMDLSDNGLEELIEGTPIQDPPEKSKLSFSIRKKLKENAQTKMFGVRLTNEIVERVFQIMVYLNQAENLQREGVFRVSGNSERQRELHERLDSGENMDDFKSSKFMVNDYATVFKSFLGELPEPLLMEKHFNAYRQVASMKDSKKQIQCLQLLVQLLPSENYNLLKRLLDLLNQVTNRPQSKMNAENLAILFTPHIIVPKKTPASELQQLTELLQVIVAMMIDNNNVLFSFPYPLIQDILHYCDEVETAFGSSGIKRTPIPSSNKRHFFSSSSDDIRDDDEVVISSTYSFTDRRASQEAARLSSTDSALTELYTHVSQMPESSRKRKLLKEFNKVHGTPVSSCTAEKPKKSESIGASIRRLMSKRKRFGISSQIIKEDNHTDDMRSTQCLNAVTPLRPSVASICDTPACHQISTPVAHLFQTKLNTNICENFPDVDDETRPVDLSVFIQDCDDEDREQGTSIGDINDTQTTSLSDDTDEQANIMGDDNKMSKSSSADCSAFQKIGNCTTVDDEKMQENISDLSPELVLRLDDKMADCDNDENKENERTNNECLRRKMSQQPNFQTFVRPNGYISPLVYVPLTPKNNRKFSSSSCCASGSEMITETVI